MIIGFRDGQGLLGPVNSGVCDMESGESKDDIFSATAHDIEQVFLGDPFNVCVQDESVTDCACFIHGLVDIVNGNGGGKFFSGEAVFSDKLPVNARDVHARVY